jgi:tetratricopeptide (TPR) repeat protein
MISDLKPGNLEAEQKVRQAAALASMEKGRWQEEGDFTTRMKDQDQQAAVQKADHEARNVDDVKERVAKLEADIQGGNDSIENYRSLAEYYHRLGRFDDAIACCGKVTEKLGTLDPLVDQNIEKSELGKMDVAIQQLRKQGGKDAEIAEAEQGKYAYRLERATDRVNRYPNDTELRYQLAVVYWDGQNIEGALQEFQVAQRNPHRRLNSIVYMGRCFHAKKQFDLAIEQFEKAVSEMPVMDKDKMNAVYCQGVVYEDMGQMEKAITCFKDIYQTDIKYRDVGKRIEAFYKKPGA